MIHNYIRILCIYSTHANPISCDRPPAGKDGDDDDDLPDDLPDLAFDTDDEDEDNLEPWHGAAIATGKW
jgi:hypothetical protein